MLESKVGQVFYAVLSAPADGASITTNCMCLDEITATSKSKL